jgi:hypothetical protein
VNFCLRRRIDLAIHSAPPFFGLRSWPSASSPSGMEWGKCRGLASEPVPKSRA